MVGRRAEVSQLRFARMSWSIRVFTKTQADWGIRRHRTTISCSSRRFEAISPPLPYAITELVPLEDSMTFRPSSISR